MMRLFKTVFQKLSRAWAEVRGWYAGFVLLRDPTRLDMVFVMERTIAPEIREAMLARVRSDPRAQAAIRDRVRVGAVDVGALSKLPEGTLGRAFAEFLRKNGLDPRDIPTMPADDDEAYVDAHLYETHDIWHVATGFEADIPGELGLQAFYAAQIGGQLPPLLVGGGILQTVLKETDDIDARMEAIVRGWQLGKRASQLFGTRWADLWARPLSEVRAELGIEPAVSETRLHSARAA